MKERTFDPPHELDGLAFATSAAAIHFFLYEGIIQQIGLMLDKLTDIEHRWVESREDTEQRIRDVKRLRSAIEDALRLNRVLFDDLNPNWELAELIYNKAKRFQKHINQPDHVIEPDEYQARGMQDEAKADH